MNRKIVSVVLLYIMMVNNAFGIIISDVYSIQKTDIAIDMAVSYLASDNIQSYSDIGDIIYKDLSTSGQFVVNYDGANQYVQKTLPFVHVSVSRTSDTITLWLKIYSSNGILDFSKQYTYKNSQLFRQFAHDIANTIMIHFTGNNGFFNSHIVYIKEDRVGSKSRNVLSIVDHDGYGYRPILKNLYAIHPSYAISKRLLTFATISNLGVKIMALNMNNNQTLDFYPIMKMRQNTLSPSIAVDGSIIAFSAVSGGATNIYTMHTSNQKIKKLTKSGINVSPNIHYSNKKIVFNSNKDGKPNLYTMDIDGSNVQRISYGAGHYSEPVFSHNGEFIVFVKLLHNVFYICKMRADGSEETVLTSAYLVEHPSWSPRDDKIVFAFRSKNSTLKKLKIISKDGKTLNVLDLPHSASDPLWIAD